jgi:hypothetical protein
MARLSKKEIQESIVKTNPIDKIQGKKLSGALLNTTYQIYDKSGNLCEHLPNDQIMASRSSNSDSMVIEYRVRINRNGELYNPYDKFYIDDSYRMARLEGSDTFVMAKTDKSVFNHFLMFLQTGTKMHLSLAQRGL